MNTSKTTTNVNDVRDWQPGRAVCLWWPYDPDVGAGSRWVAGYVVRVEAPTGQIAKVLAKSKSNNERWFGLDDIKDWPGYNSYMALIPGHWAVGGTKEIALSKLRRQKQGRYGEPAIYRVSECAWINNMGQLIDVVPPIHEGGDNPYSAKTWEQHTRDRLRVIKSHALMGIANPEGAVGDLQKIADLLADINL